MFALQEPPLAAVRFGPDIPPLLISARTKAVGLEDPANGGLAFTQTQDLRVQIQQVGTELFKCLVIQSRVEREV